MLQDLICSMLGLLLWPENQFVVKSVKKLELAHKNHLSCEVLDTVAQPQVLQSGL